jgi:hypothetical protein
LLGAGQAQTSNTPGATAKKAKTKPAAQSLVTPSSVTHSPAKPSSGTHSPATHASQSTAQQHVVATANRGKSKSSKHKRVANWRKRGQQKIDPQRAQDIQEALIREHYMEGTPTGQWDDASQKAMQRYQADHGWQSVMTPDSRALIKLGLGPDHAHLLNPESAMTTSRDAPQVSEPKVSEPIVPAASPSAPVSSTPVEVQAPDGQSDQPKK